MSASSLLPTTSKLSHIVSKSHFKPKGESLWNADSSESSVPSPISTTRENIKVFVRVRPLRESERNLDETVSVLGAKTLILKRGNSSRHQMKFDSVFPKESSQEDIFAVIRDSTVIPCLSGFNATILAYGQTGAGKTFTILGDEDSITNISMQAKQIEDKTFAPEAASMLMNRGLIPRVVEHILKHMEQTKQQTRYKLYCSYLEIYSEKIFDLLLRTNDHDAALDIRQDRNRGVYVKDLTTVQVMKASDIYELLEIGANNRSIRSTESNERSSRSHTIFQLLIEQEPRHMSGVRKISKLNIVDLAGSERWVHFAKQADPERINEMTSINSSLATLGNCINALSQKGRSHIPYRDSKLTRLLQDALGGNSRTVFISNISPSVMHHDETFSTLRFAERANRVHMNATINEVVDDSVLIQRYEKEIDRLRSLLKKKSERANEDLVDENRRLREDNEKLVAFLKSEGNLNKAREHQYTPSHDAKLSDKIKLLEQIEKDQQIREEQLSKYHNWIHSIPVIVSEENGCEEHSIELKHKLTLMQHSIQIKTEELEQTKKLFFRDLNIIQNEMKDKTEDLELARQQITMLETQVQEMEEQVHVLKGKRASEARSDPTELLRLLSSYEEMREKLMAHQKVGLENFTQRLSIVLQEHISDEILPRTGTNAAISEDDLREELSEILNGCCDALVSGILSKQSDFISHVHELLRKLHDVSMTMSIRSRKERYGILKKLRQVHQEASALVAEKAKRQQMVCAEQQTDAQVEESVQQVIQKSPVDMDEVAQLDHDRIQCTLLKRKLFSHIHKLKDFESKMFVRMVSLKNALSRVIAYVEHIVQENGDAELRLHLQRLAELLGAFEMDCQYFETNVLQEGTQRVKEAQEETGIIGDAHDTLTAESNTPLVNSPAAEQSSPEKDESTSMTRSTIYEKLLAEIVQTLPVLENPSSTSEMETPQTPPSKSSGTKQFDADLLRSPLANIMNYQSPMNSPSKGRVQVKPVSPPGLPENRFGGERKILAWEDADVENSGA